MEKRIIPITLLVLSLAFMLVASDRGFIQSAYAVTFDSFAITGSPNVFFRASNIMYGYNTTTDAFRAYNLLTQAQITSATTTVTGTTYSGLRCNTTDCWIMSVTGNTDCYIQRFSFAGALEETLHLTNDCSGSADMGLSTTTVYFGRKCTTGDIGSSGAGDTDLAVFSVDGNSMSGGSPVQHTDCGGNFTPISTSSQGLIGYSVTGTRLAVITNGAVGAADIFTYINLAQSLSSTTNTQLCQVTMTGNTFNSNTGRNVQFISNDAYVLVNSGGDSFTLNSISSVCAKSIDSYSAFNTGQANIGLAPDLDILYIGGTEADGTGLIVNAYDFASNTATTTLLFSVTPDASASSVNFDYTSSLDIGYITSTSTIYIIEFGGVAPPDPDEDFCSDPANANILQCRLGGTGVFGSAGDFVIGDVPTNTTDGTGVVGIGCGIGLVDCVSNPDIKTNGLGLLIFISSIFVVVGMFVRTQGMEGTMHLPVYMWAMIIIALSAFFTVTQIIEPVFLIISIIGLIALGAPKLAGMFRGGSTFGSGSTE